MRPSAPGIPSATGTTTSAFGSPGRSAESGPRPFEPSPHYPLRSPAFPPFLAFKAPCNGRYGMGTGGDAFKLELSISGDGERNSGFLFFGPRSGEPLLDQPDLLRHRPASAALHRGDHLDAPDLLRHSRMPSGRNLTDGTRPAPRCRGHTELSVVTHSRRQSPVHGPQCGDRGLAPALQLRAAAQRPRLRAAGAVRAPARRASTR